MSTTDQLLDLAVEHEITPTLTILPPGTDVGSRKRRLRSEYLDQVRAWHGEDSPTYKRAEISVEAWYG